jgi:formyl-CoA transferase
LPGRANRGNSLVPGLYGMFTTADGHIAVVGVVGSARTTFFEVVGRPDLTEQFDQLYYFDAEKGELYPHLDAAFLTRTTAEWCELLREAGVRHAPVRNYAEVVADPGSWENGYFSMCDDGGEQVVGSPVRFTGTPARVLGPAPELGQHTEEVLLEAGFSWEEIAALSEQGAI